MVEVEFQFIKTKEIYYKKLDIDLEKEKFLVENDVFEYILNRFPNSYTSDWKIKINGSEFYGF